MPIIGRLDEPSRADTVPPWRGALFGQGAGVPLISIRGLRVRASHSLSMTDWIADGIAAGALVLAGYSYVAGRGQAKSAGAAAKESRDAARDAADAARRSADAVERQTALAEAAAAEQPVPWRLQRVDGNSWHLLNDDTVNHKYDVRVDAYPGMRALSNLEYPATVSPGSALAFLATAAGYGERGRGISVTWRDTPDGPMRGPWECPLGS